MNFLISDTSRGMLGEDWVLDSIVVRVSLSWSRYSSFRGGILVGGLSEGGIALTLTAGA